MDYDDIDKIAELMDDTAKTKSGPIMSALIGGASRVCDYDYDVPKLSDVQLHSSHPHPLLNHNGTPAKSVTLLEMSGYKVMPRHPARPKTAPQPAQVAPSIPKLGTRKIEL